jgi:hypothetical protein
LVVFLLLSPAYRNGVSPALLSQSIAKTKTFHELTVIILQPWSLITSHAKVRYISWCRRQPWSSTSSIASTADVEILSLKEIIACRPTTDYRQRREFQQGMDNKEYRSSILSSPVAVLYLSMQPSRRRALDEATIETNDPHIIALHFSLCSWTQTLLNQLKTISTCHPNLAKFRDGQRHIMPGQTLLMASFANASQVSHRTPRRSGNRRFARRVSIRH